MPNSFRNSRCIGQFGTKRHEMLIVLVGSFLAAHAAKTAELHISSMEVNSSWPPLVSGDGRIVTLNSSSVHLWSPAEGSTIRLPGVSNSVASGLSYDGAFVALQVFDDSTGERAGYRWSQNSGLTSIGGQGDVAPLSMSSDGSVIAGAIANASTGGVPAPFLWTSENGMEQLPLPSGDVGALLGRISGDGRTLAGAVYPSGGPYRAVRWPPSANTAELGNFEGKPWSRALDVSSDGKTISGYAWRQEIVDFRTVRSEREAFRWTEKTGVEMLGSLSEWDQSVATVLSADGSLVLGTNGVATPAATDDSFTREMFVWSAEYGNQSLTDLIEFETGVRLAIDARVDGISDDNRVVVGRTHEPGASGNRAWAAVFDESLQEVIARYAVPEPASCGILFCATAIAYCRSRFRRAK